SAARSLVWSVMVVAPFGGQVRGEPPNGGHDVVRLRRREVRPHLGEVLHPRPGGGEEGVQRVPGGGVAVGVVPLIPRARVGRELLGEGVEGGDGLLLGQGRSPPLVRWSGTATSSTSCSGP